MILKWTDPAEEDLRCILIYIFQDNPEAAEQLDMNIHSAADSLLKFPCKGKPGTVAGTRELLVTPRYKIVYEVDKESVTILALLHTSRQWPPAS